MSSNALHDSPINELPKLFVFDLDYTLWPFWCDTHITKPLHLKEERVVEDNVGFEVKLYGDVVEILETIRNKSIPIAVASRTHDPEIAEELLNLLKLNQYIGFKEIYPGSKMTHFMKIASDSGLSYKDMVFFDDEMRNINEIGILGVTCQFVQNGVTWDDVNEVIHSYKAK